jgi:hypothetical protein
VSPVDVPINHDEWQNQVIDAAKWLGWSHLHVRRTRGRHGWTTGTNLTGWPDLYFWNERRPMPHVAIECKVGKDLPTQRQLDVLAGLAAAGDLVAVAWPRDLVAITAMFQSGTPMPFYVGPVRPEGKAR